MNNREVIEWLRKKAETVPMPGARKMYQAAAKALEAAQPELGTNLAEVGTECISRQAVIDLLKQMRKDGDMIPWEGKDVFARIRKLPSAQPERRKGKWHRRFYPQIEMMVCSECQEEFSYDAETGIRDYNYCPNCGAKMEE